jgi:hypothetical protein
MLLIMTIAAAFAESITEEAGWAEIASLSEAVTAFSTVSYSDNDSANAEQLLQRKPEELAVIEARAAEIMARYDDRIDTAAAHLIGVSLLGYATMLTEAPPPASLSPEEVVMYRAALAQMITPITSKGIARLEGAVTSAKAAGVWTEWSEESQTLISAHTGAPTPRRR